MLQINKVVYCCSSKYLDLKGREGLRLFGKLLLFAIIIAIAGGAWMVYVEKPKTTGAKKVIKNEKEIYTLLRATEPGFYKDDYGLTRVYGSVKNESSETCAYAKLEVELRDKEEKLLKKLKVVVKDIGPKATKSYDINVGTSTEGLRIVGKINEAGFGKK